MKKSECYVSDDGCLFKSATECEMYEKSQAQKLRENFPLKMIDIGKGVYGMRIDYDEDFDMDQAGYLINQKLSMFKEYIRRTVGSFNCPNKEKENTLIEIIMGVIEQIYEPHKNIINSTVLKTYVERIVKEVIEDYSYRNFLEIMLNEYCGKIEELANKLSYDLSFQNISELAEIYEKSDSRMKRGDIEDLLTRCGLHFIAEEFKKGNYYKYQRIPFGMD